VAVIGLFSCLFFGLVASRRLGHVPSTTAPAAARSKAKPQARPRPIEAGPNSSKPIAADQKLPELLAVDQKGTSDGMEIEVVDAAKNKLGKLQIVVRITNQSPTVVKRPYFSFALMDEFDNRYGIAPGNAATSLYPGKSLDESHAFDMPVAKAEYVILIVANQARHGKHFDGVRFKIPKRMWTGGQ
jgi:hypothetical protein